MAINIDDVITFFENVRNGDYDFEENDIESDIEYYVREGKIILDEIKNDVRGFLLESYDKEDVDDILDD